MSSAPCVLQFMHTDMSRSWAGRVSCGRRGGEDASAPRPRAPGGPRAHVLVRPHLGVLQPHLQLLHGHQPHLLVAAGGGEQPQEVPRDAVDGLPAVELVAQHVQDVLLHALRQLLVPRPEGGRQRAGRQAGGGLSWGRAGGGCAAHLPGHELALLLGAELLLSDQELCLAVLLLREGRVWAAPCRRSASWTPAPPAPRAWAPPTGNPSPAAERGGGAHQH